MGDIKRRVAKLESAVRQDKGFIVFVGDTEEKLEAEVEQYLQAGGDADKLRVLVRDRF